MDPQTTFDGVMPSFIGDSYFCETGVHDGSAAKGSFYTNDPLFDAEGCEEPDTCCEEPDTCCAAKKGPWFCTILSQPTTENIEMRICTNSVEEDEDVLLESVEIYVQ